MADTRYIPFRLRKGLDDDLFDALKSLNGTDRAELCRNGLRLALGMKTHKVAEVREVPLPRLFIGGKVKSPDRSQG